MENEIKVITHNGSYHADDVCAVATLAHLSGGLDKIEIIRTRDKDIIAAADYVVDVGNVYDPTKNLFDHHQPEGAGVRENGIPYASFGLVWKEFGEKITGSKRVAEMIDKKMVAPIDADDNGFSIAEFKVPGIANYRFQEFLYSFAPTWQDHDVSNDDVFNVIVKIAFDLIEREIKRSKGLLEAEAEVLKAYEESEDKRLVILDNDYPWGEIIGGKPEPLFVIYPSHGMWRAKAVKKDPFVFGNRKDFPAEWAGKRERELAEISGVPDALFCHRKLFTISAVSKEGAIALARIAIDR